MAIMICRKPEFKWGLPNSRCTHIYLYDFVILSITLHTVCVYIYIYIYISARGLIKYKHFLEA